MSAATSKGKKKRNCVFAVVVIIVCAIIALALINNYRVRTISDGITFDEPPKSGIVAHFTLSETNSVKIIDDEAAIFDMGSRHSMICRESLEHIITSGLPYAISPAILYTKDDNGKHKIYTQKLTIDISLPNPECEDSVFWIRNVDFLIDNTIDTNILGMDVLKHCAIQRLYKTNDILLYIDAPKCDYQEVCDLSLHESLLGSLFDNEINRASVSLMVNGESPHCYFMDTGRAMRLIEVVQPERNLVSATGRVEIDSLTGMMTQNRCKVKFGNRLRFSRVIYENDLHTDKYGMNPFNFFNQDCIIDIPNRKLLIRRHQR